MTTEPVQFIWLSDLHFDAAPVLGHDPVARLDRAVDHINAHYPDAAFVVISGDVVETASAASYKAVRARLERLAMPYWAMTGNHDRRDLLRRHLPLPPETMARHVQYVLDAGPARLICLDTLSEGEDGGYLCAERLDWLSERLTERPQAPALIFMHHPPVDLGLPMLDADKLKNGTALLARLEGHPQVRRLCCGHVHRPVEAAIEGLSLSALRAVLYQAPPPVPAWDWESFAPAQEAPELGVVQVSAKQITLQRVAFCDAAFGVRD